MLQTTMLSVQEQMRLEIQKVKQDVVEEFKREVQESEKRIMTAVNQQIQLMEQHRTVQHSKLSPASVPRNTLYLICTIHC
jgi:hypothetical protein